MKPIIFNQENVFSHLKYEGEVATFRTSYPDDPQLWVRRSRTGEKEFDCEVVKVEKVAKGHKRHFHEFQGDHGSGFQTAEKWIEKVKEIHGNEFENPEGWIIVVRKTS